MRAREFDQQPILDVRPLAPSYRCCAGGVLPAMDGVESPGGRSRVWIINPPHPLCQPVCRCQGALLSSGFFLLRPGCVPLRGSAPGFRWSNRRARPSIYSLHLKWPIPRPEGVSTFVDAVRLDSGTSVGRARRFFLDDQRVTCSGRVGFISGSPLW